MTRNLYTLGFLASLATLFVLLLGAGVEAQASPSGLAAPEVGKPSAEDPTATAAAVQAGDVPLGGTLTPTHTTTPPAALPGEGCEVVVKKETQAESPDKGKKKVTLKETVKKLPSNATEVKTVVKTKTVNATDSGSGKPEDVVSVQKEVEKKVFPEKKEAAPGTAQPAKAGQEGVAPPAKEKVKTVKTVKTVTPPVLEEALEEDGEDVPQHVASGGIIIEVAPGCQQGSMVLKIRPLPQQSPCCRRRGCGCCARRKCCGKGRGRRASQ